MAPRTAAPTPPTTTTPPDPPATSRHAAAALASQRDVATAATDLETYRIALDRRQVTFHEVAGAWFHLSSPDLTPELRPAFQAVFPELLDVFAQPRGGIITSYFCRNLKVAAVLTDIARAAELPESIPLAEPAAPASAAAGPHAATPAPAAPEVATAPAPASQAEHVAPESPERGNGASKTSATEAPVATEQAADPPQRRLRRLRASFQPPRASSSAIHLEPTFGDPDDWRAKQIIFDCLDLHYRALEFLTPKPRKICMRMVFGVITALLGTLDARHAPGAEKTRPAFGNDPREAASLERELAQAERYYARSAQRTAQLQYFTGMLVFGLPLLLGFTGLATLFGWINPLREPLIVCLLVGGLGAVVSVMNRMTSGKLVLTAESGRATIRLLGAMRPLIGAVFGVAMYVLLAGGLVTIAEATTGTGATRTYFYAAIAFAAGFSERFAQDMLAGAAGGLTSTPGTQAVAAENEPRPKSGGS